MLYGILSLICDSHPSRVNYAFLRNVCKSVEKLANVEQKVIMLKKCKELGIFPPTIKNVNLPLQLKKNINSLKILILNKSIRECYSVINQHKQALLQHGIKQLKNKKLTATSIGQIQSEHLIIFNEAYRIATRERSVIHIQKVKNWSMKQQTFTTPQSDTEANNAAKTTQTRYSVTDLSGQLSNSEKEVLSLGPKFIIKQRPNQIEMIAAIQRLRYGIQWKHFMQNSSHAQQRFIRYPYEREFCKPPPIADKNEAQKVGTMIQKLMDVAHLSNQSRHKSNLTNLELNTLKSLKKKNLIFLPSDKGGEFCCLTSEQYNNAAMDHLRGDVYKQVRNIKVETVERKINTSWNQVCQSAQINDKTKRQYSASNSKFPYFYCLIKTHKDTPLSKVRPIVSSTQSPDRKLVWLISQLISSLVDEVSSHLQSSQQLIDKISRLSRESITQHGYPFSLDVAALYTSVPPQEAIATVTRRLAENNFRYNKMTQEHIGTLLQAVLSNRRFTFNGQQFEQVKGLAMGSRLSGILATLVMDDLERKTITADLNIALYARYVDDIFIVTKDKQGADRIFDKFNNQHNDIKFTIEHPSTNNELSLLDFKVMFTCNSISFNYFQKDAKKNLFPHFRSAVPQSQMLAFVSNEYQRVTSKCSTQSDKNDAVTNLTNKLSDRGYPKDVVNSAIAKQNITSNQQAANDTLFFKFPYISDAVDRRIKNIIKKAQQKVQITRRGYNMRALLSKKPVNNCPGDCGTRKCQSRNIVYEYTCKCVNNYIGSTKRCLHNRVEEHIHPAVSQKPSSITLHRRECNEEDNKFNIIGRGNDVVDTRIKEGLLIQQLMPTLNEKDELTAWLGELNINMPRHHPAV